MAENVAGIGRDTGVVRGGAGLAGGDVDLEGGVAELIAAAGLCRPQNRFFARARSVVEVDPGAALVVGVAWQAMTRAFMFTTLAGVGVVAGRLARGVEPGREVLGALQTAFTVIGDDLANGAPDFAAVAPGGVAGVHYVWWGDTIVAPLVAEVGADVAGAAGVAVAGAAGVAGLIANMERLGSVPLGAAVQLRVVEAIALDIAVAFRRIYGKVPVGGGLPFREPGGLDWIDAHIKAETSHAKSVSDDETGMTLMAATAAERAEFLRLAEEYTRNWALALDDLHDALTTPVPATTTPKRTP